MELNQAVDILTVLITIGFMLGVILTVMAAAARIGWMLAPYLFFVAAIVWLFSPLIG